MCIAFPQSWILIETEDNQIPPSFSKPWKYMSRVKDGESWEGYFLPSPSSRGDHTLLRRTQGRVVRARESTADNRLPFTALTATSCFASQPNPLLFFSSQQKDFSKFLPCEHAPSLSTLFSSPLSTLFSHFTFPPSLPPLLRSHDVSFIFLSLVSSPCTTPLTGMGLSRWCITLPQLPQTVHCQCFSYLHFQTAQYIERCLWEECSFFNSIKIAKQLFKSLVSVSLIHLVSKDALIYQRWQ